jgi:hypothetical protein
MSRAEEEAVSGDRVEGGPPVAGTARMDISSRTYRQSTVIAQFDDAVLSADPYVRSLQDSGLLAPTAMPNHGPQCLRRSVHLRQLIGRL